VLTLATSAYVLLLLPHSLSLLLTLTFLYFPSFSLFSQPHFSIFGDAVNTASRMESTSEAMRVQVSAATARLLAATPRLVTTFRGFIEVKGEWGMFRVKKRQY
jgi:hypothetical protein